MLSLRRLFHIESQQRQSTQMDCKTFKNKYWCISIVTLLILAACIHNTKAVPTNKRSTSEVYLHFPLLHRVMRDVTEQKEPASGESMIEQPQAGQCLHEGILMDEKAVYCEKKLGCRAIQKTGHCCFDYKCDCQKDGVTYLNGDKLVDPGNPCTVCYCQGGEILCSSVTCFQRDDCTPKYIPGRCCPEYNDCPIISPDTSNNISLPSQPNSFKSDSAPPPPYNYNITIKEITKRTEIRITDDNQAIPIHHLESPSSTTTTTTSTTSTTTAPSTTTTTQSSSSSTTTTTPTPLFITEAPKSFNLSSPNNSNEDSTILKLNENLLPTAPISPVANNNPNLQLSKDNHQQEIPPRVINNNESLKLSASVAYLKNDRLPSMNNQAFVPPEELSTNSKDDQGLQIFSTNTFSLETDLSKTNIKRENFPTNEGVAPGVSTSNPDYLDSSDVFVSAGSDFIQQNTNTSDSDAAGSDLFHTFLTTDGNKPDAASTDSYLGVRFPSSTEGIVPNEETAVVAEDIALVDLNAFSTEGPHNVTSSSNLIPQGKEDTINLSPAIDDLVKTPTAGPTSIAEDALKSTTDSGTRMEEDDNTLAVESNPAYPSLPEDDFSIRDGNFPLNESDDVGEVDIKDEPRSIIGLSSQNPADIVQTSSSSNVFKSTKHLEENQVEVLDGSGSGNGSDLVFEMEPSSTASSHIDLRSFTTENIESLRNKAKLMYSAEDSSAETAILNSTDFKIAKIKKDSTNVTDEDIDSLETETLESLLMLGSGSGSGSGSDSDNENASNKKHREPTTPRPTKKPLADLDIDDLGQNFEGSAAAPAEDPKLDVESLKIDKNDNDDNIGKIIEASGNANVLSLNTKVTQTRALDQESFEGLERIQRLLLRRIY